MKMYYVKRLHLLEEPEQTEGVHGPEFECVPVLVPEVETINQALKQNKPPSHAVLDFMYQSVDGSLKKLFDVWKAKS